MTAQGNGNGHHASGQARRFHEDDEGGTTIDSGAAVCRFNRLLGGRLERWQWRTVPPGVASQPGGSHALPRSMDLVDPHRGALIDHFMPLGTTPEDVVAGTHQEYGDFVEGEFRSQAVDTGGELRIGMLRDGAIRAGKRVAEVRLAKSSALRPGAPDIASLYRIINSSLRPMQILFALEFNLYAPGIYSREAMSDGFYLVDGEHPADGSELGSIGVSQGCTSVTVANAGGEMAVQLGWDRECDLWRMPAPDDDPGVRLFAVWRIQLPPRDNWAMGLWLAPG